MDNQALAVLIAVALFGALAIGVISQTEARHKDLVVGTSFYETYSSKKD